MAVLKELKAKHERHEAPGRDLAAVYAGLGYKDQAFAWLEKDFQARSGLLVRTRWEPSFESLRSDPRYADLLRRMGLKLQAKLLVWPAGRNELWSAVSRPRFEYGVQGPVAALVVSSARFWKKGRMTTS